MFDMSESAVTLSSPAKLNLFLEVKERRKDGFHELETVMLRTSFCDELTVALTSGFEDRLTVTGDPRLADRVPTNESNLILRAAAAFREETGFRTGCDIRLSKVIPMEAGLAGGSSNAATMLLALNGLAEKPLKKSDLHQLAATLGSDINFFVEDCEAAVCTGRGECVVPFVAASSLHFVVARPEQGNATPAVFKNLRQLMTSGQQRGSGNVVEALKLGSVAALEEGMLNRLTESACQLNPGMADLLHGMSAVCERPAAMSGSGSTCFVCCKDQQDAADVLKKVLSLQPRFAMALQSA
ncbi:MAG: 4-(cytidine 5'-diphospho)-2-C-methyl-D-erythritol kinase [Fuerstiella sp.]